MQSTHGQIRAHIYKPFQHLWCLHVIGMSSTSELKTPRVDKNHANHTQWFCSPYSCHSSCLFSFLTQSISNEIRIHKTFVINFLRHLWFSVHIISSFLWITSSRVFPPLISLEVATPGPWQHRSKAGLQDASAWTQVARLVLWRFGNGKMMDHWWVNLSDFPPGISF